MPENNAAWLIGKNKKLEVKTAPYTHPNENQIVVRNHAVAINPLDWIVQILGNGIFRWITYPFVIGTDVAGEVLEIGQSVTRFKVGDRVLGYALSFDKDVNSSAQGAFQHYTILDEHMSSTLPDSLEYHDAAVLPLALSTAASGMFQKDFLALNYPSLNPTPQNKTVLIWGGSTSVGNNAIQLAKAAGYHVITTASPKNFINLKKLGADEVFDYHSPKAVQDIIGTLKGKTVAGALAISYGSNEPCLKILRASKGTKFISTFSGPVSFANGMKAGVIFKVVSLTLKFRIQAMISGIKTKQVYGSSLKKNEVSKVIYEDYLPRALAENKYITAPQAEVIGSGLESIQKGFDIQRKGVSAKKIVVTL
jgi:NADPH:quinone reductase-like Zn-dependent oxidoreductase